MLPIKSCSTFCLIKYVKSIVTWAANQTITTPSVAIATMVFATKSRFEAKSCIISPTEWAKPDRNIIPTKGLVMWRDTSHTMRCLQHMWVRWRLFNRQVYSSAVSGHHKQNRFCKIWHMNPCHAMCFCSSTHRRHDGQQHDHKNNSSRRYPRTRRFLFPTRWFTTMAK